MFPSENEPDRAARASPAVPPLTMRTPYAVFENIAASVVVLAGMVDTPQGEEERDRGRERGVGEHQDAGSRIYQTGKGCPHGGRGIGLPGVCPHTLRGLL